MIPIEKVKYCGLCKKKITFEEWREELIQPSLQNWEKLQYCSNNCGSMASRLRKRAKRDNNRGE